MSEEEKVPEEPGKEDSDNVEVPEESTPVVEEVDDVKEEIASIKEEKPSKIGEELLEPEVASTPIQSEVKVKEERPSAVSRPSQRLSGQPDIKVEPGVDEQALASEQRVKSEVNGSKTSGLVPSLTGSRVGSSKRSSTASDTKPHLSFAAEPNKPETPQRGSLLSETVVLKRPSTVSQASQKRFSFEPQMNSMRTVDLLDILNQLPKETLEEIKGKGPAKIEFLLNLVSLLNVEKVSRAEISSKENIQLTELELQELVDVIPDEHRPGIMEAIMNQGKPSQLRSSRVPSLYRNKSYSIPAVELLDVFNRLPKETLDEIQQQEDMEFLKDLYDTSTKAETSSQDNINLTGQEMLDLVDIIPEGLRKTLLEEESTFGEVLRDLMLVQKRTTMTRTSVRPSKVKEVVDEATQKALAMKQKIEDRSKKINELKGHMQYYLSKSQKDTEDRKKIQTLKCEIQCSTDCLKNMIKEFIKLQRDANITAIEPIMLATTLDEDQMPKCLGLGPTKSDQNRFMTPSVLRNIKRSPSIRSQGKMASDNSSLARERCHLQHELLNRDRIVENLQENLQVMQCELTKMTHENMQLSKKIDCIGKPKTTPVDVECQLRAYKTNADALEQNITKMALALNQLQLELKGVESDRESLHKTRPSTAITCPSRRSRGDCQKENLEEENHDLKQQYALLLQEYGRKEREIKDLNEKLRKGIEAEQCSSPERIELGIVRKQLNELLDEQEEFKIIIREQSTQVEEYRDKFMKAQQTVEEQRRQIENMEVNNGQIEQQINIEIQRIKNEFQKKLREFTPLPKMLENEQLKLHESQKKNRALEEKLLECVSKLSEAEARAHEFQSMYKEANVGIIDDLRSQVETLTDKLHDLKIERDRLEDNLHDEKCRYETLRGETAKIIQRANDRHETSRKLQHEHLTKVENDLAKAKADAAMDASMHEATVRKVENQMKMLTCNFDDAQSQIRNLQNHIAFLTNGDRGGRGSQSAGGTRRSPRDSLCD